MAYGLSPTSEESARLCKFKFLHDQEIKHTELSGAAAEAGSACHGIIQQARDSKAMSETAMAAILPTLSLEAQGILQEIGVPRLGILWPEFEVHQEEKLAINGKGQKADFDGQYYVLRGICDMWGVADKGKQLHIWDWKSNFQIPPAEALPFRQTLLYAVLICKAKSLMPELIKCNISYIRYGAVREKVYAMADVEAAWKSISELWESLQVEKDWKAQIGHLCQYCRHVSICPAIHQQEKAGLKDQVIHAPEEAVELANWLRALKKQLERIDGNLRRWADANGEIPLGNGEVMGYRERKGLEWQSAEKAVKKCIELGVPRETIWKHLSFGKTLLGKVTKDKEIAAEVEKLAVPTTETRFEVFKKEKA